MSNLYRYVPLGTLSILSKKSAIRVGGGEVLRGLA